MTIKLVINVVIRNQSSAKLLVDSPMLMQLLTWYFGVDAIAVHLLGYSTLRDNISAPCKINRW